MLLNVEGPLKLSPRFYAKKELRVGLYNIRLKLHQKTQDEASTKIDNSCFFEE